MLTPISSNSAAPPQAATSSVVAQGAKAASASRVHAQDRVTISPAGQKTSQAAGDVDHDGDSH